MIDSRTQRYFRDKVDAKNKKGIFEIYNLWIAAIYKVNIINISSYMYNINQYNNWILFNKQMMNLY